MLLLLCPLLGECELIVRGVLLLLHLHRLSLAQGRPRLLSRKVALSIGDLEDGRAAENLLHTLLSHQFLLLLDFACRLLELDR